MIWPAATTLASKYIVKTAGGGLLKGAAKGLGSLLGTVGGATGRGVGSIIGGMVNVAKNGSLGTFIKSNPAVGIGAGVFGLSSAISKSKKKVTPARVKAYENSYNNPYSRQTRPTPARVYGPGYQTAAMKHALAANNQNRQPGKVEQSTEGLALSLHNTRHSGGYL